MQRGTIARIKGGEHLVRLLQQVRAQRFMILFQVPRTAPLRIPQPTDHPPQAVHIQPYLVRGDRRQDHRHAQLGTFGPLCPQIGNAAALRHQPLGPGNDSAGLRRCRVAQQCLGAQLGTA